MTTRTILPNQQNHWLLIDATDIPLGRLATQISKLLRGKHKPSYSTHSDAGDFVVVVNAEKVKVTGNKVNDKLYHRYTGYPGGIRTRSFKEMLEQFPERIIETAVKGMMPKNRLGRQMRSKLKVYAGQEHPHQAQQPQSYTIEG